MAQGLPGAAVGNLKSGVTVILGRKTAALVSGTFLWEDRSSMAIGIGTGMYTLREASRLTGLSVIRVKGWLMGYPSPEVGKSGPGPLIRRDPVDGPSLSFLDLIEILFVNSFLKHGVTMGHIREAAIEAMDLSGRDHPFAVSRFETDGKKIFARVHAKGSRRKHVVGVVDRQFNFDKVVSPFFKKIDYRGNSGDAMRWWPMGRRSPVVLDPQIAFGAPVTKTENVPVSAILSALSAGETQERVAKWFDIPLKDVRAAAKFERHMAA